MSAPDKEIARERMSKMMSEQDSSIVSDESDEIQQDEQEMVSEEPVIELEEDDCPKQVCCLEKNYLMVKTKIEAQWKTG